MYAIIGSECSDTRYLTVSSNWWQLLVCSCSDPPLLLSSRVCAQALTSILSLSVFIAQEHGPLENKWRTTIEVCNFTPLQANLFAIYARRCHSQICDTILDNYVAILQSVPILLDARIKLTSKPVCLDSPVLYSVDIHFCIHAYGHWAETLWHLLYLDIMQMVMLNICLGY